MTKKGRREQKGSSLILVVCVMAFVTAVCLMILLTVYSLNRRMKLAEYREQCRIMAESVSLWISDELTAPIYRERPKDPEASLFDYVGYEIMDPKEGWPNYDPEGGEDHGMDQAARRFVLQTDDAWPEAGGEVHLKVYWTKEEPGVRLYVEVTCSLNRASSSVNRVFCGMAVEDEGEEKPEDQQEEGSLEETATPSEASGKNEGGGEDEREEEETEGQRMWKWEPLGREFEQ